MDEMIVIKRRVSTSIRIKITEPAKFWLLTHHRPYNTHYKIMNDLILHIDEKH